MSIESKIRGEVLPPMRIAWNGVQVMMVADVSVKEIDGVIERLEKAKAILQPKGGLITMGAAPIEIKLG